MKNRDEKVSEIDRPLPSAKWPHYPLWNGVRDALKSLPAYFHSDTFIEGISATDIFTLNSALGATIENQVVDALNSIRNVWDPDNRYPTYIFRRQPQSFPDVVLVNLSNECESPLMGVELKGWYLLAKEGEPSLRFTQTEVACAEADLIMVVPWVLNSVISGRPKIFSPYIESAKYVARYRNFHWRKIRASGNESEIIVPESASPYPRKTEATTDSPKSDKGGNFGRIARSGIMDEYLQLMRAHPVCGIRAEYWLEFFKIFHQDATNEEIRAAFSRLRKKVELVQEPTQHAHLLNLIVTLENMCDCL